MIIASVDLTEDFCNWPMYSLSVLPKHDRSVINYFAFWKH